MARVPDILIVALGGTAGLRASDDASRQQEMAEFIRDLEGVRAKIEELGGA